MPAKTKKQEKFMRAVAHSPSFAKKVGVPMSVGREFTKKESDMPIVPKMETESESRSKQSDYQKKRSVSGAAQSEAMKKGGKVKKMASGGLAAGHKAADGVAVKGKTRAKKVVMAGAKGMKYGGKC